MGVSNRFVVSLKDYFEIHFAEAAAAEVCGRVQYQLKQDQEGIFDLEDTRFSIEAFELEEVEEAEQVPESKRSDLVIDTQELMPLTSLYVLATTMEEISKG